MTAKYDMNIEKNDVFRPWLLSSVFGPSHAAIDMRIHNIHCLTYDLSADVHPEDLSTPASATDPRILE